MFDNLKEKLGSFRKEAEEAAEENVEELDEEEIEELGEDEFPDADGDQLADEEDRLADEGAPEAVGADTAETVEATTDAAPKRPPGAADPAATDAADVASNPEQPDAVLEGSESDAVRSVDRDEAAREGTSAEYVGGSGVEAGVGDESAGTGGDGAEADEETNSTGFGRKAKSFVRGKFVIEEEDLEGPLQELELALLSSDVEMSVAEEILDAIRDELVGETRTFTTSTGEVVEDALREAIRDVISVGQFDFDERIAIEDKPVVIVFTGVNGVGKTTSIAKLDRYLEQRGYSTVMANGDTYRAGANEQIREHAEARGTRLIAHEQGGDPAAVLYDAVEYAEANDVDVVLGDTAGRLHTDEGLMDQLAKIDRVVGPDMTLFVDEAVAGQDAVNRAREFDAAAEIDGTVLTKADADANGGAAISIAYVTGKPILFLGVGQAYDDVERFDPDEMVDRLLAED